MKRNKCISWMLMLAVIIAVCAVFSSKDVEAVSNKKVYNAYAKALSNGTIKFKKDVNHSNPSYELRDLNGDGVKELLVITFNEFSAWTYKNGTVSLYFKHDNIDPILNIYYDKGKRMFWVSGEGDGGWYIGYTKKNKQLKRKVTYCTGWKEGDELYAEKIVGNKSKEISISKYNKMLKKIRKNPEVKGKSITKSS